MSEEVGERFVKEVPERSLVRVTLEEGFGFWALGKMATIRTRRESSGWDKVQLKDTILGVFDYIDLSDGETNLRFTSDGRIPCTYNFNINKDQVKDYQYWTPGNI